MVKRKRKKPRRCRVCIEQLLASGACPYDCDPALARPAGRTTVKVAARREAEPLLTITERERLAYRSAVREIDPMYGKDFNPWLRIK